MEILTALQKLAEGNNQRSEETNFLIEKSFLLAASYLGINHKKIFSLLQKGEYSINEIAIDAISSLFINDDETNLTPLATAFLNWKPKIEDENDASFFLNKVVSGRVEQHIFSLLREYDPFFSKILDSVNYLIKTGGYKKVSLAGKTFIVNNDVTEICGNIISREEIEIIPVSILIDKKKLLPSVFNYICDETDFVPAIPLNDLIYRLKHINFAEYLSRDDSVQMNVKYELTEYTDHGFKSAKEKLQLTYLNKGKLSTFETECIERALKDMSNDLLDGGISPGMYNYLAIYMNNLEKEYYLQKYNNILEYLVKVMKSSIAEKLKR